jgi:Superinfection immunity protein
MHLIFALLLIPFGAIHFLPTIIAALRHGRSVAGIFLLNLFFGMDRDRLGDCADLGADE